MDNITVLQLARIGDFVQTLPLLQALRARYPAVRVRAVVDRSVAELAAACALLDETVAVDLCALHPLRDPGAFYAAAAPACHCLAAADCDLLVNCNYAPLTAVLTRRVRNAAVRGYAYRPSAGRIVMDPACAFLHAMVGHPGLEPCHLADYFRLIGTPDVCASPQSTWLTPDPAHDRAVARMLSERQVPEDALLIGIHPATRHRQRQWPARSVARFAALLLGDTRVRIVLTGTSAEQPVVSRCLHELQQIDPQLCRRVIDLSGETSLPQLIALCARLPLLVSGDTGILHVAAAAGCRVVGVFFSSASAFHTGPYGDGHMVVQYAGSCSPCREDHSTCRNWDCRRAITAEQVHAACACTGLVSGAGAETVFDATDVVLLRTRMDALGVTYETLAGRLPGFRRRANQLYRPLAAVAAGAWTQMPPVTDAQIEPDLFACIARWRLLLGHDPAALLRDDQPVPQLLQPWADWWRRSRVDCGPGGVSTAQIDRRFATGLAVLQGAGDPASDVKEYAA